MSVISTRKDHGREVEDLYKAEGYLLRLIKLEMEGVKSEGSEV